MDGMQDVQKILFNSSHLRRLIVNLHTLTTAAICGSAAQKAVSARPSTALKKAGNAVKPAICRQFSAAEPPASRESVLTAVMPDCGNICCPSATPRHRLPIWSSDSCWTVPRKSSSGNSPGGTWTGIPVTGRTLRNVFSASGSVPIRKSMHSRRFCRWWLHIFSWRN